MFLKSQDSWTVTIPPENIELNGLALQKAIIIRLMDDFAAKKSTKELGYFLAVTTLDKIGDGKINVLTGDVLFPVEFSCITFKIFQGEVLEGVVQKILKHGVFLKCGPMDKIYLSKQKMPEYEYVAGENPIFVSKTSKMEKDMTVRFKVIGVRYMEAEGEFQAVCGVGWGFPWTFVGIGVLETVQNEVVIMGWGGGGGGGVGCTLIRILGKK